MENKTKHCIKCNTTKSIEDFTKYTKAKDGRYHCCKICRYGHEPHKKENVKEKKCCDCGEIKKVSNYAWRTKEHLHKTSRCKDCENKLRSLRGYSEKHKECKRRDSYKEKYGITISDYNRMFKEQNGVCKICSTPPNSEKYKLKHLHVDHCHTTGKVRGLLCSHCNKGLGLFKDNVEVLKQAINYLK